MMTAVIARIPSPGRSWQRSRPRFRGGRLMLALALCWLGTAARLLVADADAERFVVCAYNVENWLTMDRRGQPGQPKPEEEREAVAAILGSIRPDVLGVSEIGTTDDLADLKSRLAAHGLEYPYQEWVRAADTVRHVALLSRFPILERHSRSNDTYLLDGRPMRMQRGILDVRVQVNDHYWFRALVVHFKSKRRVDIGDQAQMRLEEARLLRGHIGKTLKKQPRLNLLVMGDLNDTEDSEPVQTVIGNEPFRLLDLKPVSSRGYYDTHYWRGARQFSRIDYLLVSPGMAHEYVSDTARIADPPGWEKASDHRAIHATFYARDLDPEAPPATAASRAVPTVWVAALVVVAGVGVAALVLLIRRRSAAPGERAG
jgi:endonuclease/exonuclease/phosphatase family metal-dependent hydrolase